MSNPHQFWNPNAEGIDAFEDGPAGYQNPYTVGTMEFDAWEAGWFEAAAVDAALRPARVTINGAA